MKVGLNLFSIRNLIQTEEDFLKTALKLKEMGYSYLQYSGADFKPERIKKVSEESGLPVYLTHVPMERIIRDTEKLMEEHAVFGCKNIGLGMMPLSVLAEKDSCKKTVEELDLAGEKMKKNGYKLFYHHHHFEFFKNDGVHTAFEYILENSRHIHFTADTYWLQYGGVDVLDFIAKLKGRVECVHLKDSRIACEKNEDGNFQMQPKFAPVGDGMMNFKKIVKKFKEIGTEYFFVEQDDAADYADPLKEVARSAEYIKKEL